MTIGIDIRVLARGTRTGIEEYVLNLLPRLLPLDPTIKYKLFYNAFKKVKLDYPWLNLPNVKLCESKIPNRALDFFSQVFKYPKINKFLGDIDIFFSPHFLPVSLSKNCRRVITFHDLSFKHHPHFFSQSRKLWHFLTFPKSQAKKADKIFADSESTKEDLVDIYKINPKKIEVIYLGISEDFRPVEKNNLKLIKVRKKYKLPENFVLYFGTIEPRKNLILLISAFEILKEKFLAPGAKISWKGLEGTVSRKENIFTDLKLVIAGVKGWLYKDILNKVNNSKFKNDIIFTGLIDDKDKPYLYNLASAFVYPSFFEGFGFPPLEAMACGVPTIVSNASSLSEVVGSGAIMIDPYNIDELSFAIIRVLEDNELRENLIKKGLKQAKKFNWDTTAEEVLKSFKKL